MERPSGEMAGWRRQRRRGWVSNRKWLCLENRLSKCFEVLKVEGRRFNGTFAAPPRFTFPLPTFKPQPQPQASDKVEAADRGSPSRSASVANRASVRKETTSSFGRAAVQRAAVRDFVKPLPQPGSSSSEAKVSLAFVLALAETFEHGEPGLFGIAD